MADILEQLAAHAVLRVRQKEKMIPADEMEKAAREADADTGFPFRRALQKEGISFICECKKASPSKGLIAPDFPYLQIAEEYEEAGAAAVSCLTEPEWFLGKDEYLKEIAENVKIPVLRKDFTVDPYMIYEAKVLGASAVLLIVSILSETQLRDYLRISKELGLSAVTECHDAEEIRTAVEAGSDIIGGNNRNLRDFTVDINNSIRLRENVPDNILFIAESGIRTRKDIEELEKGRINSVLIGETLMKAADKKKMLDELRGVKK